jgi:hypothetical protein
MKSTTEPEYITIVEGPTPDFRPSHDLAIHSILEGPADSYSVLCEMRTINGPSIIARCQQAWQEGRPVRLDYPDNMRLRQEADVVALRLQEIDEGMVLQVWVRELVQTLKEEEVSELEDDDDDDEDDGFFYG